MRPAYYVASCVSLTHPPINMQGKLASMCTPCVLSVYLCIGAMRPVEGARLEHSAYPNESMTIEDSLPQGTSRAAQVLRTVTSIIRHHPALMRQARALYRVSRYPLHREPRTMYWIDRYLRFYDSKPLYRLDANHAAAFLSFVTTKDTCAEAEEAIRFFHDRVLHRPLPDDLTYHVREARSPERRKTSATRSLWPRSAQ